MKQESNKKYIWLSYECQSSFSLGQTSTQTMLKNSRMSKEDKKLDYDEVEHRSLLLSPNGFFIWKMFLVWDRNKIEKKKHLCMFKHAL